MKKDIIQDTLNKLESERNSRNSVAPQSEITEARDVPVRTWSVSIVDLGHEHLKLLYPLTIKLDLVLLTWRTGKKSQPWRKLATWWA